VPSQPLCVFPLGAFGHFAQELNRLGLKAWLRRVVLWDDGFYLDSNHRAVRADESRAPHSFAWNPHIGTLSL
jgi:hypothetical protein